MPKLLRHYFLYRGGLLARLCHTAWETVSELMAEATVDETRPGMVAAVQTASSDLRWHPHVHALASRGGWEKNGTWHPLPYVDTRAAELLFRQKVLSFLARLLMHIPAPRLHLVRYYATTPTSRELVADGRWPQPQPQ